MKKILFSLTFVGLILVACSMDGAQDDVQARRVDHIDSLYALVDSGNAEAALELADIFYFGNDSIDQNRENEMKAVQLYIKAAELGSTEASCDLGYLYYYGFPEYSYDSLQIFNVQSYSVARGYWSGAAKRGYKDAKAALKMLEESGLKDYWEE